MLGNVGHLGIIISLVASVIAVISYYQSGVAILGDRRGWLNLGRTAFVIHFFGALLAVVTLFVIIYQHKYEYYYAWRHSSNELPVHFIISCFWEGQEGSFLIWIIWNALVGLVLIVGSKKWESTVLIVFGSIQFFLLSMILGVYITPELKIGSTPFALLRDVTDIPIFESNPNFIPENGNGLNPLLQNIWMVIHPPFIFLGFALSTVPFAFCIGGLFKKELDSWIKPAHVWLLITIGVLALGIMMGAYWAYETLNFGGYWNWDPVENAILIPWLIMLAGLHGIILYKKRSKGLLFTTILVLAGFLLIVYATFLTRSGILGNASVHSFTDLGLSGQLLIFLLITLAVCIYAVAINYKSFSSQNNEESTFSYESIDFWMFIGICILCLSAFQILLPTSIPVFNKLVESIGMDSNMAPPADQVGFYSKFQIWFAIAFGLSSGIAQLIYWLNKTESQSISNLIFVPTLLALLLSSVLIFVAEIHEWRYIILITTSIYGLVSCIVICYHFILNRKNLGGPLAHIGFSIMILGFVFSAGYSKIVSTSISLNAPESNLPRHTIRENTLLNRNKPQSFGDYTLTYRSASYQTLKEGDLISKDELLNTNFQQYKVQSIDSKRLTHKQGDTIQIESENTYYEIEVKKAGKSFIMRPRMQDNPSMGFIASPSISSFWNKDFYMHVTNFPDPKKVKWSEPSYYELKNGDKFEYAGLEIQFEGSATSTQVDGVEIGDSDIPIVASLNVTDNGVSYQAKPVYLIKNGAVRLYPDEIKALGIKVLVERINPSNGSIICSISASQRDWITVKAIEMPHISLVWIGTLILTLGVGLAVRAKFKQPIQSNYKVKPILANNEQGIFTSLIINEKRTIGTEGKAKML